eukprot:2129440-Amphidinium_carterae.2
MTSQADASCRNLLAAELRQHVLKRQDSGMKAIGMTDAGFSNWDCCMHDHQRVLRTRIDDMYTATSVRCSTSKAEVRTQPKPRDDEGCKVELSVMKSECRELRLAASNIESTCANLNL